MGRGYIEQKRGGVRKYAHVWKAEDVLGHKLPAGAEVHHVDGNRANNSNSNLVICRDRMYHELLHKRAEALEATGDPNKRKCNICKRFDDPDNLSFRKHGDVQHKECARKYRADRRAGAV